MEMATQFDMAVMGSICPLQQFTHRDAYWHRTFFCFFLTAKVMYKGHSPGNAQVQQQKVRPGQSCYVRTLEQRSQCIHLQV